MAKLVKITPEKLHISSDLMVLASGAVTLWGFFNQGVGLSIANAPLAIAGVGALPETPLIVTFIPAFVLGGIVLFGVIFWKYCLKRRR